MKKLLNFIFIFSSLLYADFSSTTDKNVFTGSFDFYTDVCKKEKILKTSHEVCIPLHIIGKYRISFLLHEPVVQCNAKYYIEGRHALAYISIDDKNYYKTDFPKKEWKKISVSDIRIKADFTRYHGGIIMDAGAVMGEGKNSFNAALSPEWDKFVIDRSYEWERMKFNGTTMNLEYLDKKKAVDIFKAYSKNNTKNILTDFDARADFYTGSLLRYIFRKEKKDRKKREDELENIIADVEDNISSKSNKYSLDDIINESINTKSNNKKSTYFSRKSKPIEKEYQEKLKLCKKTKPSKYFTCSEPLVLLTVTHWDSQGHEIDTSSDNEDDSEEMSREEKCAQEEREWRNTYEERLRKWNEEKESCEARALQEYNNKIKKIQQEENDIDSIWDSE